MAPLAAAPTDKEIASNLRRFRGHRMKPDNGTLWFSGRDASGERLCALCGWRADRLVRDHCHATGIIRGLICHACNSWEAGNQSPAAWAWRRTAPGLKVGERVFYDGPYHFTNEPAGLAHSSIAELLTLPMPVLLERAAEHDKTVDAVIAAAIGAATASLFGELAAARGGAA